MMINKPNIALFLSGRITCYDENLIPILEFLDNKYNVHLFISINSCRDDYHIKAENLLSKWLKNIVYEEYNVPDNFIQNTHPETLFQNINGIKQPYTVLSCFYNDRKAYNLIVEYSGDNNIKYDVYVKFRPDLIFKNLLNINFNAKENVIHSCIPPCEITFWGDQRAPICVNDAFSYGNKEMMEVYTRTYEHILKLNNLLNGKYRINYELVLTESIFNGLFYYAIPNDNYMTEQVKNSYNIAYNYSDINALHKNYKIKINYFNCQYNLNPDRRFRDKIKKD